jgi:hypothetical protein
MRLSRPSISASLTAAGLAAALSCTTLPAFAGAGHDQSQATRPAVAEQARQKAADHTQALMALQKRWANAQGSEKSRTLQQMITQADERRAFLAELIKTNPAEVLRVTIPEEKQVGMPAEVVEKLEQKLELSGQLEVFYEDREDGSHRLRHFLITDFSERFELHFAGNAPELMHGSGAAVLGVLFEALPDSSASSDGDIGLTADNTEVLQLAATGDSSGGSNGGTALASSATFGAQSTLVINVNFQDNPVQPWTKSAAQTTVFGTTNDFIRENSYQQTSLSGAVTGWFTLPLNSTSCDSAAIITAARERAAANGFDLAAYNRFIYAFPYTTACPFSGAGSVGGSTSSMLINGSMNWYTVAHEMGHNLGLYHSHALDCGSVTLGSNCTSDEYGDGVDIMGRVMGHYNAFQKERLGWLDSTNITTVSANGVHELETYSATQGSKPKALKLSKGIDTATGQPSWYYVEFRQPTGFDSVFSGNANVLNGVVVHSGIDNQGNSSYLLDMTPNSYASSYADSKDPALETGQSFFDSSADITLATDWVDSNIARVNVDLGGSTASCVRANPGISMTPGESAWVGAGSAVSYSLTLTSRDSSACASKSFGLSASKPSGWSTAFGSASLTLAPGQSRTTTLTVTSPTTAADGFYTINATAAGGGYSAAKSVTYVVDTPVSNSAPTARNDSASTAHNTAVTINVLGNDTDPDNDALNVTGVAGVNGTATINANGTIRFTPANGFSGTEKFTYFISDGKGGTDSATVSVSVATAPSSNSAPVAVNDVATLPSKTATTIAVLNNDWDPEGTALTISGVTQGAKGDVRINANGTLTYTPGKPFKSDDSFSYTITDGEKTATASVQVQLQASATGGGKGGGSNKGNKPL